MLSIIQASAVLRAQSGKENSWYFNERSFMKAIRLKPRFIMFVVSNPEENNNY